MIHRSDRNTHRIGQGFGIVDSNEQRAYKSWALSYRNPVEIGEGDFGFLDCLPNNRNDTLQMMPGSQLRDDAPELSMDRNLRGNDIRENGSPFSQDRCRGLITGGFDSESQHGKRLLFDAGRWNLL